MNIRKNIDYTEMYEALDVLMAQQLPQMELYCGIGKAVCRRTEKGAAVMASEYLNKNYPDVKGFSPRSLRRMRDFYRTYEDHPALLSRAMKLGWTQNVVIMEADLTMDLREWYMKAAEQFGWSKAELIARILANAHEEICLTDTDVAISQEETETTYQAVKANGLKSNNCEEVWKVRKKWFLRKSSIRRRLLCFERSLCRWRFDFQNWDIIVMCFDVNGCCYGKERPFGKLISDRKVSFCVIYMECCLLSSFV